MAKPRKSTDDKLAELNALNPDMDIPLIRNRLREALADANNRVAAKAAELCAEHLLFELDQDLVGSYQRFLDLGEKRDSHCIAKQALVRALVSLDYSGVDFYLEGLAYRQLEPVWGGSVDTAVDIRCSCAMGLAATSYLRAGIELTALLYDSEMRARIGAVQAIACLVPHDAELLLRSKVLSGDEEPEVIGACFSALLSVEPDHSPEFVEPFLYGRSAQLSELAALALGESRLDEALDLLLGVWDLPLLKDSFRRMLLRAIALNRSEKAFQWLLTQISESGLQTAGNAIEAVSIFKHNERLHEQLKQVLFKRGDERLEQVFSKYWD